MRRALPALLAVLLLAPLATSAPLPPLPVAGWVSGAATTYWWAADATHRASEVAALEAARMNTWYVDGKDGTGRVGWYTEKWPMAASWKKGDDPIDRAAASAHGVFPPLTLAVRVALFADASLAARYPEARIGTSGWVDPAAPQVQDALLAQLEELVRTHAVDEVNLDFIRYPVPGVDAPSAARLPYTGGTLGAPAQDLVKVITAFAEKASARITTVWPLVAVSADVFGGTCSGPIARIGQDAGKLADLVTFVMPMVYPSAYGAAAVADPYGTVSRETAKCVRTVGDADKVKPWIQGYGPYAGDIGKVNLQIDAVRDAGGTGAVVWWFPAMGESEATWAKAAPHQPLIHVRLPPGGL